MRSIFSSTISLERREVLKYKRLFSSRRSSISSRFLVDRWSCDSTCSLRLSMLRRYWRYKESTRNKICNRKRDRIAVLKSFTLFSSNCRRMGECWEHTVITASSVRNTARGIVSYSSFWLAVTMVGMLTRIMVYVSSVSMRDRSSGSRAARRLSGSMVYRSAIWRISSSVGEIIDTQHPFLGDSMGISVLFSVMV